MSELKNIDELKRSLLRIVERLSNKDYCGISNIVENNENNLKRSTEIIISWDYF